MNTGRSSALTPAVDTAAARTQNPSGWVRRFDLAALVRVVRSLLVIAVIMILGACSALGNTTPTPLPTVALDGGSTAARTPAALFDGGVTASGAVIPAQQADLSFVISGNIETVEFAVGERVDAGQVLVRLKGKEDLVAAISAAEYEVASAEKALEDLRRGAGAARSRALERISTATEAVRDATYQLDNFTVPAGQAGLGTRVALDQTAADLDAARLAFEPFRYFPSSDDRREDLRDALNRAQAAYNAAVKRLQYETELEVARAELEDALGDFETWNTGPDPAELALAEARLANAHAAEAAARAQLDNLELRAPFSGTVSALNVHSGEWIVAGQPAVTLADVEHLRIETTDLSERDIPKIEIGRPVSVFIKALGLEVEGRVVEIAPLADTLGGDVVYKTTIELGELPPGLRAGMSVEVQFRAD